MKNTCLFIVLALMLCVATTPGVAAAQVAVKGEKIYTMAGDAIENGVIVVTDGKIAAIGAEGEVEIPEDYEVLEAKVVTPGLIDARATVGLTGIMNIPHDQDQFDRSGPIQPELRAIDAYNPHERLVEYVRSFGITTLHAGHAPGELITGQTMIVKTTGHTIEDAVVNPEWGVAATLSTTALRSGTQSPGTRGKMVSMLREQLIRAQEYRRERQRQQDDADDNDSSNGGSQDDNAQDDDDAPDDPPGDRRARDLRLETLVKVLDGELKLIVTADRAQDIASALRLKEEFDLPLVLDSAAEAYLLIDQIKEADVPVLIHPSMYRATGERENLSFETASKLVESGIPVAMQSGYEGYVPKTRVVLFEAALTVAYGLDFEQALGLITADAARILGIDDRVGTIEVGKDGDLALYDGDPFEYTTKCVGVVIEGEVVSREER